ncbi:MAG: hypothetical protein ACI9U2_001986, partial [Bradymonadia bacterium]
MGWSRSLRGWVGPEGRLEDLRDRALGEVFEEAGVA